MKGLFAFAFALLFAADGGAYSRLGELHSGELPKEARATLLLIQAGGPFPYEKDGAAFGNREGILPPRRKGYYREFTVKTPGARDRGARRIVSGNAGEYYYTDDHYRTFRRILQ